MGALERWTKHRMFAPFAWLLCKRAPALAKGSSGEKETNEGHTTITKVAIYTLPHVGLEVNSIQLISHIISHLVSINHCLN